MPDSGYASAGSCSVSDCCRLDRPGSHQEWNKKGTVSHNVSFLVPPGVQETYGPGGAVTRTGWVNPSVQNCNVRNSTKGFCGMRWSLLRKDFAKLKARIK